MGFLRNLFFPIDADEQAYKTQQKERMRYERDLQKQKEKDRVEFEIATLKRTELPKIEVKEYETEHSTRSYPIGELPSHFIGSGITMTNIPWTCASFHTYDIGHSAHMASYLNDYNQNITLGYHNSKL